MQFSSHLSETEKRIKETSGQLVQQIRTRPSRQELDALRQQIAERMLAKNNIHTDATTSW